MSLLEVLIATFILGGVCLGIIAAEELALVQQHDAYLRSVAASRLINISERFAAGVGKVEFNDWQRSNFSYLPESNSNYQNIATNLYKITLCWRGRALKPSCLATEAVNHNA
ncbi:MAG: hypothetical protein WCW01_05240 [Gammaproteobacteria bacterium]|jgi:Tfp pilus assembly protein PilV